MRVQQMIEVMFATWKEGFKDHPSVMKVSTQGKVKDRHKNFTVC